MPRPEPQPATSPERPRVAKVHDPHPAAAVPDPEPAAEEPTVVFAARIPEELRDRMRWLSYSLKRPIQHLMTEALTEYVARHPAPPS